MSSNLCNKKIEEGSMEVLSSSLNSWKSFFLPTMDTYGTEITLVHILCFFSSRADKDACMVQADARTDSLVASSQDQHVRLVPQVDD